MLAGVGLRLWQYVAGTSLWLDEIAVARNILERSWWELLTVPLAYDQVAPKGFLLTEKLATSALGRNDYALRLFPLLASLAALAAFAGVAVRVLDEFAAPVALALFATAAPLVVVSAQVKQYSSDLAAAVLLLWLALDLEAGSESTRRTLWAGVAGAAAVWFSHAAVLVLLGYGAALAVLAWRARGETGARPLLALTPTLALWGAAAAAATVVGFASITAATREYLQRFWAAGFLPLPPTRALQTLWPGDRLLALFGSSGAAGLAYRVPVFYLALTALGFGLLWHRRQRVAVLLLGPIGVTVAAAVAHQYPFRDRLILFLLPSLFLALAASIEGVRRGVSSFSRLAGALAFVVLLGGALYPMAATPPVYRIEDMKPVLSYLQATRRAGDAVYVYYGAGPAVMFYGAQYGLREKEYTLGGCHRGDGRRYFEELDVFRGHPRVWIVMTHTSPRDTRQGDVLRYLDAIGLRRDELSVPSRTVGNPPSPAEVFLYDLSDAERLGNATATSFPLTERSSPDRRGGCAEGPQSMVAAYGLPASPEPLR